VKKLSFVKIFNSCKVNAIKGEKKVDGVEFENVTTKEKLSLEARGVVVEIGLEPSLSFKLPKGLKLNKRNEIDVDQNCNTNIRGLFSAGDITDVRWKQIIIAAGEGAKAALSAYDYLQRKFLEE
jgi:alkyl hydroperoxide reductase subunit F